MAITVPTGPTNRSTGVNPPGANVRLLSLPLPSATVLGDVLIATVATDNAGNITTSTPGWVKISPERTTAPDTARDVAVFHAFATESIPEAPVFTTSSAAPRLVGGIFRLVGASTTDRVSAVGTWAPTGVASNTTGMTIPATGASAGGMSIVAAYNNANSTQHPPTDVLINGQPADFIQSSYGANAANPATNSSTGIAVKFSTSSGPFTLTWGKAISNSQGYALTIPAAPVLADPWEASIYVGGVTRVPATIEGIQSAQKTKSNISNVNWQPKIHTYDSLISDTPFFIAHRGSGDNWPEHTMEAYSSAVAHGVKALELSVCTSKDGVMFCHHDLNLLKMTGLTLPAISDLTWAEIQNLDFDARKWIGQGGPIAKPVRLEEVMDAFAGTHVLFIEDKQGTQTPPLLNLMDRYPNDKGRLVWKQWAGAGQVFAAKDRGYKCWGFFTEDLVPRFEELAVRFDILGVPHTTTDTNIRNLVAIADAAGQPVIGWEVHYRSVMRRLLGLGVRGMMTSNIPYVYSARQPQRNTDTFSTGRRAAGDLPHTTDSGWGLQPKIIPGNPGVLRFDMRQSVSYMFGSMAPIMYDNYTIDFDMRYDGTVAVGSSQHIGAWFGHVRDVGHRAGAVSDEGGYHLILRTNGVLELMRHDAGSGTGVSLSTSPGPSPVLGQWMSFRVTVTPENITAVRLDNPSSVVTSSDTTYRGGYFGVQKNYSVAEGASFPVCEFRNISWASFS